MTGAVRSGVVIAEQLLADEVRLEVRLLAGARGLSRAIGVPRIQKPGLALTGWDEQLHDERVLVIGGTEIDYLRAVGTEGRELAVRTILASNPVAVIVSRGLEPPDELIRGCDAARVALLSSTLVTSELIVRATGWLHDQLAASTSLHGVLLDVLGIGILLLGKSGIGKSETALDLVVRGHRLVADDIVHIRQNNGWVFGSGSGIIRHHMEIRGLGIINIKDLFGIAAVRETKKVELVVELVEWNASEEYDRLGVDERRHTILDIAVPMVRIPVRPGRSIATIIEVAARNQLLKLQGHNSAREFQERLNRAISEARPQSGFDVEGIE